jgi:uncharacterized phage infection (PIP) family protein YhgE
MIHAIIYQELIQNITGDINLGTIVSLFVGIAALAGAIYRGISWLNQQNEKKACEVKRETEQKAEAVKRQAEDTARNLQQTVDNTARDIKEVFDQKIQLLKENTAETNVLVRDMFKQLSNRADLTNGNVAHIRNDMSDLAADIQELFEKIDPDTNTGDAMRVSREKDTRRRERKRQIEADRLAQQHPGEEHSSSRSNY